MITWIGTDRGGSTGKAPRSCRISRMRESRVGAQIVVQDHRDAAFAQQSPVVGIEVMGNKDTAHPP